MLSKGDILFRKQPFHHTMMVMEPLDFAKPDWYQEGKDVEIVHAASIDSHVYREVIDLVASDPVQRFTAYRANDGTVSRAAFGYANVWAWTRDMKAKGLKTLKKGAKGKTSYSYTPAEKELDGIARSRYYGVQEMKTIGNPPFDFDALYRAFKWANRGREAFSKNRGTTCCAFITACHQAAVVDTVAGGNFQKVAKAFKFLEEARAKKDPDRFTKFEPLGPKSVKVALGARRLANPGPVYTEFSVDEYCMYVTAILCGERKTVAETFPAALIVDAKFNYSANFEQMLAARGSGYQRLF
ncbi:MAG: hypothetical protein QOH06_5430 [Acidobacteriota bacterium]|jgi:hypothetical protein|nr:hypothetical protein [Acidobacteriota bacterium]